MMEKTNDNGAGSDPALAVKVRDTPWTKIRAHLTTLPGKAGHWIMSDAGDGAGYQLAFETWKQIPFDGTT